MTKTFKPIVYLCNSDAGDTEQYCRFALEQGQIPLSPLSLIASVSDEELKTCIRHGLFSCVNIIAPSHLKNMRVVSYPQIDYFPTTFESHNLLHFASFCLFC